MRLARAAFAVIIKLSHSLKSVFIDVIEELQLGLDGGESQQEVEDVCLQHHDFKNLV